MITYASKITVIKKTTNEGFKSKIRVRMFYDETKQVYVLIENTFFSKLINIDASAIRIIGDITLYHQSMCFKIETFSEMVEAARNTNQFNITKEYYEFTQQKQ